MQKLMDRTKTTQMEWICKRRSLAEWTAFLRAVLAIDDNSPRSDTVLVGLRDSSGAEDPASGAEVAGRCRCSTKQLGGGVR
jgi:hypothetical protein